MFGSIFCNVENFFFISLAIIFILVLLLVYLFKQRISTVEKTGNTMFDMVSRLTDEVKWLKGFSKEEEKCAIGIPVISKSVPEKQVDMGLPKKTVEPGIDTIQFEIVEPVCSSGSPSSGSGSGPVSNSNRIVVEDLGDSDDSDSDDSEDDDNSDSDDDEDEDEESLVDISLDLEVDNSPFQICIDSSDLSSELGEEVEITVDDINEIAYTEEEVVTLTPRPVLSTSDSTSDQVPVPLDEQFKPVHMAPEFPMAHHTVDDLKKMDVRQLRQLAFQKTGQDMSKTKKNELVRMLTVSVSLE